jgi:TetR/AcrR family transcriptional regulator, ethionamide resistance regulator
MKVMATLSERSRTVNARKVNQQALLDATVALLEEGTPYAEIGIEQIVRRAGLSKPTFYSYFEDKRALVLHLGKSLEEDIDAITGPWLSFADVSLRDTLANVLAHYTRHRGIVAALTEAATYDADVAAFWRGYHDRIRPNTERRIAAGHPHLTEGAVAARAYTLVWMTERSLTEHLALPTVDETDLVDQLTWMWQAATGADQA